MLLAQLITSYIAAACFGIIFNAPRHALIQCGMVGMFGWVVYYILVEQGLDVVPATIFGSMLVAILSQICAKIFKTPIIIFNVSGIIPLVPGGLAYDAMRKFVENDYFLAVQLSAKVMLLAGAIAIGLMFSEVVHQLLKKTFAWLHLE
ncbi:MULTISPECIES: threonine/serine exporter family protein [Clostridia]|uniref:threonine/serine exporter family protein n=1 Tax=Clostridia TaxID=186801 RepID=UPI000EA05E01|nr:MULTISPECIES: threonine/serine exporter family protein [Clostridia]NBJ68782.1 threonine/serine exporter [Roseburia sp. 1XD42-34]RKI80162.1 threonine/serine exporter [Clostridium sp. 1xD42-85]